MIEFFNLQLLNIFHYISHLPLPLYYCDPIFTSPSLVPLYIFKFLLCYYLTQYFFPPFRFTLPCFYGCCTPNLCYFIRLTYISLKFFYFLQFFFSVHFFLYFLFLSLSLSLFSFFVRKHLKMCRVTVSSDTT